MNSLFTINRCLLLFAALTLGCETETIEFNGPYHVRFTNESLTRKESFSDIIKIEVHNAGPAFTQDMTINYAVSGSAQRGIDYTIIGDQNNIVIKKGEYFGYIQVQLINNANNILRAQDIVFTLNTVNTPQREVGQGVSAIGKKFTLTIQDDCILSGTYSGVQSAFDIPVENITITSTDCINYSLSNWNVYVSNPPFDFPLTFVDNGDNTITIPEQEVDAKIIGNGIIDPITQKIILTITLLDANNEQVAITLTPK
jgi:hypothetical protein